MDIQKDALRRILGTVESKYFEAEKFTNDVIAQITSLQEVYGKSISDVKQQFEVLSACLRNTQNRMVAEIEEELVQKIKPLQESVKNYKRAQGETEDLMSISNEALNMTNHNEFSQAALKIKERVTMCPIFRLNLSPYEVDESCLYYVDFTNEQKILNCLKFLPVPFQPEVKEYGCFAEDNVVHCSWSIEDDPPDTLISTSSEVPNDFPRTVKYFVLQYRQIDSQSDEIPWITVEFIRSLNYEIRNLIFQKPFLEFRVQAWNQAFGGNWSKPFAISTPAFHFCLNPNATHPNLKIVSPEFVEWDVTVSKVSQDTQRVKSGNRSASPAKTVAQRISKLKQRFTGESFTVLSDSVFTEDESYFEAHPSPECKMYSIGITHRSLSKFEQLGKTATSWCIHVSSWIQSVFVAKHSNKVKNLDSIGDPPLKYGVYYNQSSGILSFYDADTHQHIHTFKQVRCNGPVLPGFLIWFGSLKINTGIQIPSWIVTRPIHCASGKLGSTKSVASADLSIQEEVCTSASAC